MGCQIIDSLVRELWECHNHPLYQYVISFTYGNIQQMGIERLCNYICQKWAAYSQFVPFLHAQ